MRHLIERKRQLRGAALVWYEVGAMTAAESAEERSSALGFAGLQSLGSDVVPAIEEARRLSRARASQSPSTAGQPSVQGEHVAPSASFAGTEEVPARAGTKPKPTGNGLLGWLAAVAVVWIIASVGNSSPSTPSRSSSSVEEGAPSGISSTVDHQRPSEVRPSVGVDQILSPAEIRYCVAESIRINGAERVLNEYSNSEIDRYNAMIRDYNGRCGQYQYRRGNLSDAQEAMEPFRADLELEGAQRLKP
jgi:hypothetical protein